MRGRREICLSPSLSPCATRKGHVRIQCGGKDRHGWQKCKNKAPAVENAMAVPQKIKYKMITWPRNSTSRYICPKELTAGAQRGICTFIFITALFTMAQKWR